MEGQVEGAHDQRPGKHPHGRITRKRLLDVIKYDARTGYFTWRVKPCRNLPAGMRAGNLTPEGYRRIKIDGHSYFESHLAWFYTYGFWPKRELDHINRVRDDNRLINLRAASGEQNRANSVARPHNKLGVKGVRLTAAGTFRVELTVAKRNVYVGTFPTLEEAATAHAARHRELYGAFSPSPA